MSIDINVHITADSNLENAISDVATCLAVISAAQSGNTAVWLPEKTVTAPEPPAEVPAKAETKKGYQGEGKAAVEGKAAQCKALLAELDVKRQSQIPTDKLDEALAKVKAL